jgi:cell division protein FtsL
MKARALALWAAAVLATAAALVVHLTLRFETVRLGYAIGEARADQRRLLEAQRLLSLEVATLSQPERIEAIVRGTLDLRVVEDATIIPMGKVRSAQ